MNKLIKQIAGIKNAALLISFYLFGGGISNAQTSGDIQELLDRGISPFVIYQQKPELLSSIYNKHYQGGIIFYLDTVSGWGLVASDHNVDTAKIKDRITYANNGANILSGANGQLIGDGQTNTKKLIQSQGAGLYAASLCAGLKLNGYTDWFLPSINEFIQMANYLGSQLSTTTNYWTSTETSISKAFMYYVPQPYMGGISSYKHNWGMIRAVRKFEANLPVINYSSVTDVEGNTYKTVQLGVQMWMAENLRATKFQDNTTINEIKNDSLWKYSTNPAWCYYNNDQTNNTNYGKLYNWSVVKSDKNVCPIGWRIPVAADLDTMNGYLESLFPWTWESPEVMSKVLWTNVRGNNMSGLSIVPSGGRGWFPDAEKIIFYHKNTGGYLWTKSIDRMGMANNEEGHVRIICLPNFRRVICQADNYTGYGLSIRCVKSITK